MSLTKADREPLGKEESVARIPLLSLLRKFGAVARHEGFAPAVSRGFRYALRKMRGEGASALALAPNATLAGPERYLHGIWQELAREEAFHISETPAVHRKRRQIAMIADLNLPQCRKYRVEQLAAFWRARGVEFEYAHYQDIPRAARIMQHATHLMEYRLQTGAAADMLRYEARRLRLPVLYDLDDPLFSVSAYETYRNMDMLDPALKAHFLGEAPKYLSMMNGADILSVSTPGMAAHTRLYSDRPVFVRRNFADQETLRAGAAAMKEARRDDGLFRVAFASGSQGHEADLTEIIEPLAAFVQADASRRLMLIGHFDTRHLPEGLTEQVDRVQFADYQTYLETLRRADCAVMPLCDDIFNRCKSAVRVLDAAAVGVPSVVGGVGDLAQVVRNGETGHVVREADGWLNALRALAEDPLGRRRMGQSARDDLERRWSASDDARIIAPELIDWVEG